MVVGFTQTHTFREYLREKVISEVNSSIKGNLFIEEIDGSLLTSLSLRNVTLSYGNDSVATIKKIVLKTSPLQLLLKRIYVREFGIENAKITFKQYADSSWNIAHAIESITPPPPDEDTTSSVFDYSIIINNFSLKDVSFSNKSIEFADTVMTHDVLNGDDIQIDDLGFNANLVANLSKTNFFVDISHMSFNTNFGNFRLLDFSGEFELSNSYAAVKNLYFLSDNSELHLSAAMENVNLFADINLDSFYNSPITLEAEASPFYFDDLTAFIGATDMLKGKSSMQLKAEGKFGDFNITKMIVDLGKSHFESTGRIQNLNTPSNFIIDAYVENTSLYYDDACDLLKPLDLPKYENLYITETTAYMQGYPTQFYSTIIAKSGSAKLNGDCFLNTKSEELEYDIALETQNFDAETFVGKKTNINSKISVEGKGTSPDTWDAKIACEVYDSKFNGYSIDSLTLTADAYTLAASIDFNSLINSSKAVFKGQIDYNDQLVPKYDLTGSLNHFDLAEFTGDSTLNSDFNFLFDLKGEHIDVDTISGKFSLKLIDSKLNNRQLPDANLELGLSRDNDERKISLLSDFADFNIYGNFALSDAIDLLTYEGTTISNILAEKARDLQPIDIKENKFVKNEDVNFPKVIDKDIILNYRFNFKDLSIVSLFLNIDELDVSGYGEGQISNDSLNFSITSGIYLNYLLFKEADSFYLTDFEADLSFSRNNRSLDFNKIFGSLSISGNELFAGNKMHDIFCDLIFNQKQLFINTSFGFGNDLTAELEGKMIMSNSNQRIVLNKVSGVYKNLEWINSAPINIGINEDFLEIEDFAVFYNEAVCKLKGKIFRDGKLDLLFSSNNIPGIIFSKYLFDSDNASLKMDFDFSASISGNTSNPKISAFMSANDIYFEKTNLGRLSNQISYNSGLLKSSFFLLDSEGKTKIRAEGVLPIDLSISGTEGKDISNESIDISVKTIDFDISQFGKAIPKIINQKGKINADITISGTYEDLHYNGKIDIPELSFRSTSNNLEYVTHFVTDLNDDEINISDFRLSNAGGTAYTGTMRGSGKILLEGFTIKEAELISNGDLALLSNASRAVSPYIYGDLFVGTNSDLKFIYKNGNAQLNGSLLLREMNLTYILGSSAAVNQNNNFIYKILVDSSKLDLTQLKIAQFLSGIESDRFESRNNGRNPFDFNLYMEIENEAKLEFILSKASNQKLVVYANGDLDFKTIDGIPNAQGEFRLQPGSKFEYFKTFQADGNIRFESDITNPRLDIIATYSTTYDFSKDGSKPEDVAVKMKLSGRVDELGKNLASKPDNVGVYVGQRNIDNNVKDERFDISDAFSLILVGEFKQNLTSKDLAGIANTANSVISSVLTSFVNSTVGDYVSDIQIGTSDTKNLTVSGKIKNIRYKLGASTDINKTNLRIEYLFSPNFLIRLERKDPIVRDFANPELINEFGIKYKFEF